MHQVARRMCLMPEKNQTPTTETSQAKSRDSNQNGLWLKKRINATPPLQPGRQFTGGCWQCNADQDC